MKLGIEPISPAQSTERVLKPLCDFQDGRHAVLGDQLWLIDLWPPWPVEEAPIS